MACVTNTSNTALSRFWDEYDALLNHDKNDSLFATSKPTPPPSYTIKKRVRNVAYIRNNIAA